MCKNQVWGCNRFFVWATDSLNLLELPAVVNCPECFQQLKQWSLGCYMPGPRPLRNVQFLLRLMPLRTFCGEMMMTQMTTVTTTMLMTNMMILWHQMANEDDSDEEFPKQFLVWKFVQCTCVHHYLFAAQNTLLLFLKGNKVHFNNLCTSDLLLCSWIISGLDSFCQWWLSVVIIYELWCLILIMYVLYASCYYTWIRHYPGPCLYKLTGVTCTRGHLISYLYQAQGKSF